MGYIGKFPTPQPLTATDIPDLPATKITSGTFPALNGSNLTNLDASDLTGTLPAISGANLTGVASGMTLLTSGDITSTTSTIAITGTHVTSTHDHYRLYLRGKAAGDGVDFYLRYRNSSNDGLISSNYSWRVHEDADNGGGSNSDAQNLIRLTHASNTAPGSGANEGFNMILDFMSPLSNLVPTCCNWWIGTANTSDNWKAQRGMARRNDGTETHTGFTLFFNTGGDFANGTNYEFYGLAK